MVLKQLSFIHFPFFLFPLVRRCHISPKNANTHRSKICSPLHGFVMSLGDLAWILWPLWGYRYNALLPVLDAFSIFRGVGLRPSCRQRRRRRLCSCRRSNKQMGLVRLGGWHPPWSKKIISDHNAVDQSTKFLHLGMGLRDQQVPTQRACLAGLQSLSIQVLISWWRW